MKTQDIKKVTTAQLTQILLQRHTAAKTAVFANITINTDARLKKRGNPYIGARKQTKMTVMFNTDYVSGVVNQLKREGKSEEWYIPGQNTMPLVFGENNHIVGFFEGKAVIQYRPFDKSYPTTEYVTADGFPIPMNEIRDFLPAKSKPLSQGTEKEILWRKTYMENVLEMTIDGTKYKIVNK